jgi:predicted DNA-binding protein YlxM (UPF0122 family)
MNTQERLNTLKDYLTKEYPEGNFVANSYSFKNILQVNSGTQYYLNLLIKEGFITKIKPSKIVNGKWELAQYQINSISNSKTEKIEEIKTKITINANNYEETDFNGIKMRLYKSDYGYVVPITDICNALKVSKQSVNQLLIRNQKLFEEYVVNVTLTTSKSGLNTCLTRDGVIGLIMKIGYNKLPEEKQQLVLDFQKWAITTLSKLISEGRVVLTDIEQAQVQNTIKDTLDFTDEDIDKLFNDFEEKVNELADTAKTKVNAIHKEMRDDKEQYDSKLGSMKNQINGLIAKTVALAERRRDEF